MRLILKDRETGRTKEVNDPTLRAFDWAVNNWSCDCNRSSYFLDEEDDSGVKCYMSADGTQRFIVAEVLEWTDGEGYTLADLND